MVSRAKAHPGTNRLPRGLIVAVLLAVLAAWVPMALARKEPGPRVQPLLWEMANGNPDEMLRVLVQLEAINNDSSAGEGSGNLAEVLIADLGGEVIQHLGAVNAISAKVPGGSVEELAQAPGVLWVSLDGPLAGAVTVVAE